MNFIMKIKRTMFVLKALLIVLIVGIILLVMDAKETASYVQENYIVTTTKGNTISKKAFVYEYTARTGDGSLATITGINQNEISSILSNTSNLMYSNTDYRGLAMAVATAWIVQGNEQTGDFKVEDKAFNAYNSVKDKYNSTTNESGLKKELSDDWGFVPKESYKYNLYRTAGGTRKYEVQTMTGSATVETCRCCCCMSEGIMQYLVSFDETLGFSIGGHHCSWVGNTAETRKSISNGAMSDNYEITYNGISRYVSKELYDMVSIRSNDITFKDMVDLGYIKPGSIFMWVNYRNNQSTKIYRDCCHIAFVTHIDNNYIYTAGAGDSRNIVCDAVLGYDKKYDINDKLFSADYSGSFGGGKLSSIVYWLDSSCIKHQN